MEREIGGNPQVAEQQTKPIEANYNSGKEKISVDNDLENIAQKVPEYKDAIEQLKPGFIQYIEERSQNHLEIKRPVIHGTGSLALESILHQGFITKSSDVVISGERSLLATGSQDVRPISLAEDDALGRGESTAHFFAILNSKNPGLTIETEKITGETRIQRFMRQAGISDIHEASRARAAKAAIESKPDPNPEASQKWSEKETLLRINQLSKDGAFTFSPEEAKKNINRLEAVLSRQSQENLAEAFFEIGILNDLRYFYSGKDAPPLPLSALDKIIEQTAKDLDNPESFISSKLNEKLEIMKNKLSLYNKLPEEEKEKIKNQFPTVILIEGDGLELKPVNWMFTCQELHSTQGISPERIREVRVPAEKVEIVRGWANTAGLNNLKIIPLEYYELESVLKANK